ncbi:hypothetical protein C8R43DRAFT_1121203 [Mycena crocata]|nr:hypothetical protein C8R43DRAFT_1121203 [Mycena crocata]
MKFFTFVVLAVIGLSAAAPSKQVSLPIEGALNTVEPGQQRRAAPAKASGNAVHNDQLYEAFLDNMDRLVGAGYNDLYTDGTFDKNTPDIGEGHQGEYETADEENGVVSSDTRRRSEKVRRATSMRKSTTAKKTPSADQMYEAFLDYMNNMVDGAYNDLYTDGIYDKSLPIIGMGHPGAKETGSDEVEVEDENENPAT